MPQEFEQAQSASASQESEDIIESVGVQVDGANDALDAVLDAVLARGIPLVRCLTTSNRCLNPTPKNMSAVSCKKAANDAPAA